MIMLILMGLKGQRGEQSSEEINPVAPPSMNVSNVLQSQGAARVKKKDDIGNKSREGGPTKQVEGIYVTLHRLMIEGNRC